jgi:hypothetical protein
MQAKLTAIALVALTTTGWQPIFVKVPICAKPLVCTIVGVATMIAASPSPSADAGVDAHDGMGDQARAHAHQQRRTNYAPVG